MEGWIVIKLSVHFHQAFNQSVRLKEISPQLNVMGTVTVDEFGRVFYLATAVSQHFLLNEQQNPIGKSCSSCGNYYTMNEFYSDKTHLFSKTSSCKTCRAIKAKEFRAENPLYYRQYWIESRERLQQLSKDWSADNPDRLAVYRARSVTKRKEALQNCFTDDKEYMDSLATEKFCVITGETEDIALDHILPVVKGRWGNTRGNLMWLTSSLNHSKKSNNVFEWAEAMEQERLDYLLPDDTEMTLKEFREKLYAVLTLKAEEKGMTLKQYKQEYEEEYSRED